jgi:hypothetical protein
MGLDNKKPMICRVGDNRQYMVLVDAQAHACVDAWSCYSGTVNCQQCHIGPGRAGRGMRLQHCILHP